MTIVVAPMRWWDIPTVHGIETARFPDDAWSLEQFWQELAHMTRHYVVARDGGVVVGYAGSFVMPPDADVQTVAVRADHQGRRIASSLLTELLDDAARRGAMHMLLEVRADNSPARALYERLGFSRINVRRRYYPDGTDAVIMRLGLAGQAASVEGPS